MALTLLEWKPVFSTYASCADQAHTLQYAAFNQELHYLLTGISTPNKIKKGISNYKKPLKLKWDHPSYRDGQTRIKKQIIIIIVIKQTVENILASLRRLRLPERQTGSNKIPPLCKNGGQNGNVSIPFKRYMASKIENMPFK